jgi:hypothetical protein
VLCDIRRQLAHAQFNVLKSLRKRKPCCFISVFTHSACSMRLCQLRLGIIQWERAEMKLGLCAHMALVCNLETRRRHLDSDKCRHPVTHSHRNSQRNDRVDVKTDRLSTTAHRPIVVKARARKVSHHCAGTNRDAVTMHRTSSQPITPVLPISPAKSPAHHSSPRVDQVCFGDDNHASSSVHNAYTYSSLLRHFPR